MDPKRVTEIEQMLTNRHDMLHYNMRALRRAGLDLLAEMRGMEQLLQVATEHMVAEMVCPKEVSEEECRKREGVCKTCWLEYWRQKSGTFQNGNNHGTTSKTETVGEGAE